MSKKSQLHTNLKIAKEKTLKAIKSGVALERHKRTHRGTFDPNCPACLELTCKMNCSTMEE